MNAKLPGMVVDIEARIDKLEKGLRRANQLQSRGASQMERRANQSADRMSRSYNRAGQNIAASMSRMNAKIAGALTAGALVAVTKSAREVVRSMAQIGDQAKQAGVGAEAFQAWSYVAKQSRIDVDALTDGFKELNLRADELIVTGGGPGAEAFARLGFSAAELKQKLEDPSELMLTIIERAKKLDRAARIRISDEVFGGSAGERFVALMDDGAGAIRDQLAEAKELGFVMDADMIAKSQELDAKFEQVTTRMRGIWRSGVVGAGEFFGMIERERAKLEFDPELAAKLAPDFAPQIAPDVEVDQAALETIEAARVDYGLLAEEAQGLVMALTNASRVLRGFGNEQAAAAFTDLAGRISAASIEFDNADITGEEFAATLKSIGEEADDAVAELDEIDQVRMGNVIGSIQSLLEWIGKIPKAAAAARKEIAALAMTSGPFLQPDPDFGLLPPSPLAPTTSPRPPGAPSLIDERGEAGGGGGGRGGGGGGGRSESDYQREIQAIREETRALELEAAALAAVSLAGSDLAGAIDQARMKAELLHAAMRNGQEITPQLEASIDAQVAAYGEAAAAAEAAGDRIDRIRQAQEQLYQTGESAFTGLVTGALSFEQALQQVMNQLIQMAASWAFKQIAGGFLFGGGSWLGGWATGGYTGDGGTFEPAGVVHRGEFVMSKKATAAIGKENLDALHQSALRGYADGGFVAPTARRLSAGVTSGRVSNGQTVNINAPVTVNANGGTPEQNADLARQVSREMENTMRGVVQKELRQQMRPGAMLRHGMA